MAQSVTPEGFNVARGRGYHPDQVDEYLAGLSSDRDAAWERAARLTVLANEMQQEATSLRGAAEAMGPVSYEALGEGAQELFHQVEAEAADVRERAEAAGRADYQAAERDGRALRERARADADACLTAADEAAAAVREAAGRRVAEVIGAAQAEADRLDGEAQRALEGVRQDIARRLAEQEKEQRGRFEALERELAEHEAAIDGRIGDLMARAERLLSDAQQAHSDAHHDAERGQAQAEAAAAEIIAQARATEERLNRESERALRAHEANRDEIRSHLANVRTSLSALTGRTLPEQPEDGPA